MNNTGSDNPPDLESDANESTSPPETRRVPIKIIVMGLVALVFAIVIGTQVIGVLYAIFFPPAAPVPENATLISHTSKDYGVDEWLYSSKQTPCDVLRFYQTKDVECRVAPVWCDTDPTGAPPQGSTSNGQNVARCSGTQTFSIFALSWDLVISTGYTADELTEFRLNREIYWTGAVPPYNPPTLDGGFPNFPTDVPESTQSS